MNGQSNIPPSGVAHPARAMRVSMKVPLGCFRRFTLASCGVGIPEKYSKYNVFAEREGRITVHAADKCTLERAGGASLVSAENVITILYKSKSGNTSLQWRGGRIRGKASAEALLRLAESGAEVPYEKLCTPGRTR